MEIKLIFMSNSFSVISTSYRIHSVYTYNMHILMTVKVGSLLFVAIHSTPHNSGVNVLGFHVSILCLVNCYQFNISSSKYILVMEGWERTLAVQCDDYSRWDLQGPSSSYRCLHIIS